MPIDGVAVAIAQPGQGAGDPLGVAGTKARCLWRMPSLGTWPYHRRHQGHFAVKWDGLWAQMIDGKMKGQSYQMHDVLV